MENLLDVLLVKKRPYLAKIIKNASWLFVDKFFRLLVSLFVVIFIVRSLGPSGFGEFSFPLAIVGILSPLSTLGINSILVREFVNYPKKRGVYLGSAVIVKIGMSLLCIIGLFLFLSILNFNTMLVIMSVIFSTSLLFDSISLVNLLFDSDLKSKYSIFVGQIVLVASTLLKILLLIYGASAIYFVLAALFESVFSAILLALIFFKKYKELNIGFNFSIAKQLVLSGFPFMLAGIGTILYMHADQVVVGYLLPVAAVGFYAVAVKLSEFFYVIPAAISTSIFPKLVDLEKNKKEEYFLRLQDLFDLMTFLAIIIFVPLSFLSKFLIEFIYGVDYSAAAPIFSLYVLSGVFIFFGYTSNNHLVIKDSGKILFYRSLLGAVLNIILSIILVYYFGLIGAAIATLICFAFTFWISLFFFKETKFLFFMFLRSFNLIRVIRRGIIVIKSYLK